MTVVVAFFCTDGVVVAGDSMLTPRVGGISVGHHKGVKVEALQGPQVFAFAGDLGLAARFKIMADGNHGIIGQVKHPIEYPIALTKSLIAQFKETGVGDPIDLGTVLSFMHGATHHCCVFEGRIQPRLLDEHHYYVALGSGKLSADPFLRFLVEIFCRTGRPIVREAIFLAAWTIQHAIETAPGGVAGPIKIATFEPDGAGAYQARCLLDDEIAEHQQAMESAADALRQWRDRLQSGEAAEEAPEPPESPDG
jgi:hypothetical protein